MSKPSEHAPARLRSAGGTDLERRLLDAATREQPSPELSERMARAIGIPLPPLSIPTGEAGPGGQAGPSVAAPKLAAGSSGSLLPWISGALIAIGAAGAIVATRSSAPPPAEHRVSAPVRPPAPAVTPRAAPEPAETPGAVPAPVVREPSKAPAPPRAQPSRSSASGLDLGPQIALMDDARHALREGNGERALEILRRYELEYPQGSFRPEAAALRIEALAKMGRTSEARALAERFVAAHGSGPLSDRVARVAGLTNE
jgi:Outer membrane lipoprotein